MSRNAEYVECSFSSRNWTLTGPATASFSAPVLVETPLWTAGKAQPRSRFSRFQKHLKFEPTCPAKYANSKTRPLASTKFAYRSFLLFQCSPTVPMCVLEALSLEDSKQYSANYDG